MTRKHQNTATILKKISAAYINTFSMILFMAVLSFNGQPLMAQSPIPPPANLQVYSNQELNFGSFFAGTSGGTVIISPTGTRSVSGTIIELAATNGHQAIFDLRLVPGRMVHMVLPASAQLIRKGGGAVLMLTDFTSDKPGNSFVTTAAHPFINPVQIGATLHIRGQGPDIAGEYTGTFSVTFIQE